MIQQVNGSSVNETTLNGLIPGTTYNITIRAYQDLLGPASEPISVDTLNGESTFLLHIVNIITMFNHVNTGYFSFVSPSTQKFKKDMTI